MRNRNQTTYEKHQLHVKQRVYWWVLKTSMLNP